MIATNPGTITTIQRVGFTFREPGLFQYEGSHGSHSAKAEVGWPQNPIGRPDLGATDLPLPRVVF